MDGHLGGAVDGNVGRDLTAKPDHPQVLDDEGIHTGGSRVTDQLDHIVHFPVGHQGI